MLLLLLVALLGHGARAILIDASEVGLYQLMNKYSLLSQCWGEQFITDFIFRLNRHVELCGMLQLAPTSQPMPDIVKSNYRPDHELERLGVVGGFDSTGYAALASLIAPQHRHDWDAVWKPFLQESNQRQDSSRKARAGRLTASPMLTTSLGNLSCVLTQLEMLDSAGNINRHHFSLDNLDLRLVETPAGSDPIFRRKLHDEFAKCYDIASAWPSETVSHRSPSAQKPISNMQVVFFQCVLKAETRMCSKFQLVKWLQAAGRLANLSSEMVDLGSSADKYDAAVQMLNTLRRAGSDEESLVENFFWGETPLLGL